MVGFGKGRFSLNASMSRQGVAVALLVGLAIGGLAGCERGPKEKDVPHAVEVTAVTVQPRDVPVDADFVGQAESSHQVEIRARVEGFLEKKTYEEGGIVKAGQVMFQMDRRPFEASLQEAKGQLAQAQASLAMYSANLKRVRPLAEKNAVSKKDLDDAVGQEQTARASVLSAEGKVRQAELNLSYTTIRAPFDGVANKARKQEGSYLSVGADNLLTTVARLDPIWIDFSVSENERLLMIEGIKRGTLKVPKGEQFNVEVILADGTVFPRRGILNFADPSFSQETGTFLVRAEFANPYPYLLRPGQFVRVKLKGAVRPNAITVPRRAVMQGAKGHFLWAIDSQGQAEFRNVTVGDWYGDDCFITMGLKAGDRVVVDGGMKLTHDTPVKIVAGPTGGSASSGAAAGAPAAKGRPASGN